MSSHIYKVGDCLSVMQGLEGDSVQLIYADPPYATGTTFHGMKDTGSNQSKFKDKKTPEALVEYLMPRFEECRRLITDTGVLCVHVDKSCVHYLKVALDKLFKRSNFINEIVVNNNQPGFMTSPRRFGNAYHQILCYGKTNKHKYNIQYRPYADSTKKMGRENGFTTQKAQHMWEKIDGKEFQADKRKSLELNPKGVPWKNLWSDFFRVIGKEKTGYPTQKSIKLLTRIINAFSDEGDLVLDPFAGSGTTLIAAQKLGREGIGIDVNPQAKQVWESRARSV